MQTWETRNRVERRLRAYAGSHDIDISLHRRYENCTTVIQARCRRTNWQVCTSLDDLADHSTDEFEHAANRIIRAIMDRRAINGEGRVPPNTRVWLDEGEDIPQWNPPRPTPRVEVAAEEPKKGWQAQLLEDIKGVLADAKTEKKHD